MLIGWLIIVAMTAMLSSIFLLIKIRARRHKRGSSSSLFR